MECKGNTLFKSNKIIITCFSAASLPFFEGIRNLGVGIEVSVSYYQFVVFLIGTELEKS